MSLDLGRVTRWNTSPGETAALPSSLKVLTLNGLACGLFHVNGVSLDRLEVFRCYDSANAKAFSDVSKSAELHLVTLPATQFGNHVHLHLISALSARPPGFEKIKHAWSNYGVPDPAPIDHSKVSPNNTGAKDFVCPDCHVLIDAQLIEDHRLVCMKRKLACEICRAVLESRAVYQKHKSICPLNVGHCHCCFKVHTVLRI